MIWMRGWLCGKRQIAVNGPAVRRFLQLCLSRGIQMRNLTEAGANGVTLEILNREYEPVRELAEKCGTDIRTTRRGGIPAFFVRSRKHLSFACGMLAAWLLVQALGGRIWRIELHGNRFYSTDTLQTFLMTAGYEPGIRRGSVVCDDLEQLLRKEYARISWVSARVEGTCLILELRESEAVSEKTERAPGNLVATTDGMVEKLTVRSGIPVVQIGDTVTAGQVLVTGRVPRYDDADVEIGSEDTRADADIVLERTISYTDTFSAVYPVRKAQKEQKRKWVRIGSVWLQAPFLPFGSESGTGQDSTIESKQASLFGDFYLPVYYGTAVKRQFTVQMVPYSKEELRELVQERLNRWLAQETEEGELISSSLKEQVRGTTCYVSGVITIRDRAVSLESFPEASAPAESQTEDGKGEP